MKEVNGKTIYGLIYAPIAISSCSIKLPYQVAYQGAHPWISQRRNGLARGIYNRMHADGRFAGRQLIPEVHFCLNTVLSTNGFSAYQLVFGSNPGDNFGWGAEDGDFFFAQNTSPPGQFVAQWELRMVAQEAALRTLANSMLRRIRAFNNSFDGAGGRVGDEVFIYEAPPQRSAPRRRGPAKVLLLGESGAALSSQGQTFKVARHCVQRKVRGSVEHEASREDAPGDLCRSPPPRKRWTNPRTLRCAPWI